MKSVTKIDPRKLYCCKDAVKIEKYYGFNFFLPRFLLVLLFSIIILCIRYGLS